MTELILLKETQLAKEVGVRRAGYLFKQLGSPSIPKWDAASKKTIRLIHPKFARLTRNEVVGNIIFREAGATSTVQQALEEKPSYSQLVEALEKMTAAFQESREECRQLRQAFATMSPVNGLGERAKKALASARSASEKFSGGCGG